MRPLAVSRVLGELKVLGKMMKLQEVTTSKVLSTGHVLSDSLNSTSLTLQDLPFQFILVLCFISPISAMANDPSPPPRGGLSLYANLLDPAHKSGATISAAPVSYKQEISQDDEAAKKQQALAGTYMSRKDLYI